jgi:hypothetical protein
LYPFLLVPLNHFLCWFPVVQSNQNLLHLCWNIVGQTGLNTKNQSIIIIKLFVFLLNQSVPRQGKKKSLFAQQYSSTGVKDFGLKEAGVPGENHRPWASNW